MVIETKTNIVAFIAESNRIEGINRLPTDVEYGAYLDFMKLQVITVGDMEDFVRAYQPDAYLRTKSGINVQVGNHIAPPGGMGIAYSLANILYDANQGGLTAYEIHQKYEHLHPFTDGNGRSGRMLWKWMMKQKGNIAPLGFLHHWYYQSLDTGRV